MKIIAVPTFELSEIIQNKLISLGYHWNSINDDTSDETHKAFGENTFLYIDTNGNLYHGEPHETDVLEEITLSELFKMKPINNKEIILDKDIIKCSFCGETQKYPKDISDYHPLCYWHVGERGKMSNVLYDIFGSNISIVKKYSCTNKLCRIKLLAWVRNSCTTLT